MTCQLPCTDVTDVVRGYLLAADLCECDVEEVAQFLGVSTETVRRRLSNAGTSWRALKQEEQERRLRALVKSEGRFKFIDAARDCGFYSPDRFSAFFKQITGDTYRNWQKRRGESE